MPQTPTQAGHARVLVVVAEILRMFRRAALCQVAGRSDEHDRVLPEASLQQVGIRQRRVMAAHGDVEPFLHQVDEAVVQPPDPDLDDSIPF